MTGLFFIICFLASSIGSICGVGGGIMIKPVLDALGIFSTETASFLSGCTVLAMTSCFLVTEKLSGRTEINHKIGTPLAAGSAFGGVSGKLIFTRIIKSVSATIPIVTIQAVLLMMITSATLIYMRHQKNIKTHSFDNAAVCLLLGALLGLISSFLGIGGGPLNIITLHFFFSMSARPAAANSLYIIFFSQAASMIYTMLSDSIPQYDIATLTAMITGGIIGGYMGRLLSVKLGETKRNRLFYILLIFIIFTNIYSIYSSIPSPGNSQPDR